MFQILNVAPKAFPELAAVCLSILTAHHSIHCCLVLWPPLSKLTRALPEPHGGHTQSRCHNLSLQPACPSTEPWHPTSQRTSLRAALPVHQRTKHYCNCAATYRIAHLVAGSPATQKLREGSSYLCDLPPHTPLLTSSVWLIVNTQKTSGTFYNFLLHQGWIHVQPISYLSSSSSNLNSLGFSFLFTKEESSR